MINDSIMKPVWRLMRTENRTCFHTLYDENMKQDYFYLKKINRKKKDKCKTVNLLKVAAIFFQLLYQHAFETIYMPSK